jgi:hypothetical protein
MLHSPSEVSKLICPCPDAGAVGAGRCRSGQFIISLPPSLRQDEQDLSKVWQAH